MRRWLALFSVLGAIAAVVWLGRLAARSDAHTRAADAATAVPETGGEATLDPARWTPRPPSTTSKLEGWVGDPAGHGIAGATVCATALGEGLVDDDYVPWCVTTGEDGRYVHALPLGRYEISASAPRHVPAYAKDDVSLEAGRTPDPVDVILTDGGVPVSGRVEDPLGRPVAGARVTATSVADSVDDYAPAVAFTDADGQYVLSVPAGSTWVEVAAKDHVRLGRAATAPAEHEDFALVFGASLVGLVEDEAGFARPGVRVDVEVHGTRASARTGFDGSYRIDGLPAGEATLEAMGDGLLGRPLLGVVLAAGDLATAPRITVHAIARVVATVRTAAGPCKAGDLLLDAEGRHAQGTIAAHGTVVLPAVFEGAYTVRVQCTGFAEAKAQLTVGPTGVVSAVYDVVRGGEVEGTVVDASGKPVVDGSVHLSAKAGGQYLSGVLKAGKFRVAGLGVGTYEVRVTARGFAEARSTLVVPGVASIKTSFVLVAGAVVEGTVLDALGAPMVDATVELLDAKDEEIGRAYVGPKGHFLLRDLPAGAGKLRVSRGLTTLPLLGPTPEGVPITLAAGTVLEKALTVEAFTHSIRGSLVDAAGVPVVGVVVEVRRTDADGFRAAWTEATTGVHGAFVVPSLPPGDYSLAVLAPGGSAHASVTADATVALKLVPYGRILGRVIGAKRRVQIHVESKDLQVYRGVTFFGTGGAFAIGALPPGTYEVQTFDDGVEAHETVTVTAGGEASVTLFPAPTPLPASPIPPTPE